MLRDDDGSLIAVVALLLGTQTNHLVEVETSFSVIKLAYERGFKKFSLRGTHLILSIIWKI